MKIMRAALPEMSMEQFATKNLETLFGLELEEYLENATDDKGMQGLDVTSLKKSLVSENSLEASLLEDHSLDQKPKMP